MMKILASLLVLSAGYVHAGRHQDHALHRFANQPVTRIEEGFQKRREPKYQFLTDKTKPYLVESLPLVKVPIGEMYSGSLLINKNKPERTLFFVFYPTINEPVEEITVWLNGGPACSSLAGFFQENGPIVWPQGTWAPYINPYSWVNLTNMLWVEYPVGTGFTTGEVTATSEEEIAGEFISFFKNFQDLFGIKNHKIYMTGESYAGRYVPYISAAMLDQKDETYFNLSGALMYDPCIGDFDGIQAEYPVVPFVEANANLFNFNESFLTEIQSLYQKCGYESYVEKYLAFPPAGVQPPLIFNFTSPPECDVFNLIYEAAVTVNPCFDVYEIPQMCPWAWDVLSFPPDLAVEPPGAFVYFNRSDVKAAMHAPEDVSWALCNEKVFRDENTQNTAGGPQGYGDFSADPIQKVLPRVIEATNRVLVSNGDYDMIIITNGTLMAIQNMTWNGKLGFQQRPSTPINIARTDILYEGFGVASQGIMGVQHYERGLMWAETYQAGHTQPQFQPLVSYRHLEWVLGRVKGNLL